MIRRLLCRTCCDGGSVYLVDKKDRCGWSQRHVWLVVTRSCQCDECGCDILGQIVHAVTGWKEGEPRHWEDEFGEVIPAQAVKVSDSLVGGEE